MGEPRVAVSRLADGTVHRWVFFCPGCGTIHHLSTGWTFNGDPERPTFSPSVLSYPVEGIQPRCHSFVVDGRIQFLSDSEHDLKGKTVDLPLFPFDLWDFYGRV